MSLSSNTTNPGPQSTARFAIQGCYNNANFGDVLLMDVMSHYAGKYLGVEPFCPWVHRESRPFVRTRVGGGIRDIFGLDAAFFGGGGYFCDYFRRSLNYAIPARIWQAQNTPYAVLGVGVGPFITAAAERQFRVVCDGAAAICVRDDESKEQLSQFGASVERIEVTTDAGLSLTDYMIPSYAIEEAKQLLASVANGRRLLGIHWAAPGPRIYSASPPFHSRAPHRSLIELIGYLKECLRNSDDEIGLVWLLGHTRSTSESIRSTVEAVFPNSLFLRSRDHWVITALLSLLDGVLTTMLHVGITAWTLGTPPCAWASHGKTRRFYRQIGRDEFVHQLGESGDQVMEWIRMFRDAPEGFGTESIGSRERLRRLAHRNYEVLAETVGAALRR